MFQARFFLESYQYGKLNLVESQAKKPGFDSFGIRAASSEKFTVP